MFSTIIVIFISLVQCSGSSTDPSFRTENEDWIFVHIEGAPRNRGYQYGTLVADEIADFITVLRQCTYRI